MAEDDNSELWKRQYQREKSARKEAEELLENKSRELYLANEELKGLTKALEERVAQRTKVIEQQRNAAQRQTAQLQESEKRFQDVIEAAGEYVWETDPHLRVTYLSAEASKSLEYEIDELVGYPLISLFENQSDQDQKGINALIEGFHDRNAFKGNVLRCRDKLGKLKWHSISGVPRYSAAGTFEGFRGTGRDISDIQQARDEVVQAARAKSEFFSNMSHEIRTPLNGIVGMSQIMLESQLREDQFGYAKTIKSSADSLVSLINEIFDISVIESGNLKLNEEDFSIDDLIDDCIDYISMKAEQKGLLLELVIAESVPQFAYGDEGRIRQSIVNLLHNAVKFTTYGEVRISISTTTDDTGEQLAFEIRYTGIGISDTEIETIFKSYESSHSISYQREGGTGLGLAISKGIAEKMGGLLKAESTLDSDSSFKFQIPLVRSSKPSINYPNETCWISSTNPEKSAVLAARLRRYGCETKIIQAVRPPDSPVEPDRLILFRILSNKELDKKEHDLDSKLAKSGARIINIGTHANLNHPSGILYIDTPVRSYRIQRAIANQGTSRSLDPESSKSILQGKRTLVIDDNSINLQVAEALLAQLGTTVDTADSGAKGIELLDRFEYDLILMDVRMPTMNGIETTQAIRSKGLEIPIVAVTANAGEGEVDTFLAAGMNGYVPKPLFRSVLIKELERCFHRKKPETAPPTSNPSRKSPATFDATELMSLLSGDLRLSQSVTSEYIKQTEKQLTQLKEKLDLREMQKSKGLLHNLSGSSYNLRATAFGDACFELSKMITDNVSAEQVELQRLLIADSYKTLKVRLREFLKR